MSQPKPHLLSNVIANIKQGINRGQGDSQAHVTEHPHLPIRYHCAKASTTFTFSMLLPTTFTRVLVTSPSSEERHPPADATRQNRVAWG